MPDRSARYTLARVWLMMIFVFLYTVPPMKKLFCSICLCLLMPLTAMAQANGNTPNEPDTPQLLRTLLQHDTLVITGHPSCKSVFMSEGQSTLGEYLYGLLGLFEEPGNNLIRKECLQAENGESGIWHCSLMFQHNEPDNEVFYTYGVEFDLNDKQELITNSLTCPGAG